MKNKHLSFDDRLEIEKGLKELKVSKNKVDIKVLENEDKRSFFSWKPNAI